MSIDMTVCVRVRKHNRFTEGQMAYTSFFSFFFLDILSLSSFLITGISLSADTSSPEGRGEKGKGKKTKSFCAL